MVYQKNKVDVGPTTVPTDEEIIIKKVDLKGIHFSIIKQGDTFSVKRKADIIKEGLESVDAAGKFIHIFCYGAKTV